jgi:hypothetical protein
MLRARAFVRGHVSGHDFSRAEKAKKDKGFSPCVQEF